MKGAADVTDAEGNEFCAEPATVTLCRCGGSEAEPFCDCTHSRFGFRSAERTVREKGERD